MAGLGAAWLWILTFVRMTGGGGRRFPAVRMASGGLYFTAVGRTGGGLHSTAVILGLTQDPGLRGVVLLGSGS